MIQLRNKDCLEGMKELAAGSVDMILTDLPYQTTCCRWDKKIPLKPLWTEFKRVLKDEGTCVLFGQMPFSAELVTSAQIKFRYKYCWEKSLGTGFFNAKKCPLRCHEDILVFYQRLPTYNVQWRRGEAYSKRRNNHWRGEGVYNYETARIDGCNDGEHYYPRDVLHFDSPMTSSEKRYHSTQKPVALLEYLIKTYTNEGELVLDAAMGSGSTGAACLNTGRQFIGYELDEKIYEVAQERIAALQAQRQQSLFH